MFCSALRWRLRCCPRCPPELLETEPGGDRCGGIHCSTQFRCAVTLSDTAMLLDSSVRGVVIVGTAFDLATGFSFCRHTLMQGPMSDSTVRRRREDRVGLAAAAVTTASRLRKRIKTCQDRMIMPPSTALDTGAVQLLTGYRF